MKLYSIEIVSTKLLTMRFGAQSIGNQFWSVQSPQKLNGLLRQSVRNICQERQWSVLSLEVQPDHIHLFVSIPPATSVADAIKILKGSTARKLFVKFPELKKQLWGGHLWSPSYYVGTAGNVSSETIQKYIERTEHIKGRR